MSWALVAQGIDRACFLAASTDINDMIANEALIGQLTVFPDVFNDAGIYLWTGSVTVEDGEVECIGSASKVEVYQLDSLMGYDGREEAPE